MMKMKNWGERDGNLKERSMKWKRRKRRFCLFTTLEGKSEKVNQFIGKIICHRYQDWAPLDSNQIIKTCLQANSLVLQLVWNGSCSCSMSVCSQTGFSRCPDKQHVDSQEKKSYHPFRVIVWSRIVPGGGFWYPWGPWYIYIYIYIYTYSILTGAIFCI